MGLRNDTLQPEKINFIEEQAAVYGLRKLSQYIIYAGVGILGGAVGVALAIAAAIVIQSLMPPLTTYAPNVIVLTLAATVIGLGISWLLGYGLHLISSDSPRNNDGRWLQVTIVFSVLTSLLQTILYMEIL